MLKVPGTVFWRASSGDALGNVTSERLGNQLQTTRAFDAVTGRLSSLQTVDIAGGSIQNLGYSWDKVGNLKQRRDLRQNLTEEFYYDTVDRLDCSTVNIPSQTGCSALSAQQMNLNVDYNPLGNITYRSDVGTYGYDAAKIHAVTSAGSHAYSYDANGNVTSRDGGAISWYSFNLPKVINGSADNSSEFFYTARLERWKQVARYAGAVEETIYIGGLVEKVTAGALTSWKHYITGGAGSVAVYTRQSDGTNALHYLTRDHLGSVDSVTTASGALETRLSYGAFGERRAATWSGDPSPADQVVIGKTTRRGFTFHEMLDNLSLTHMNGRVYDQRIGRFLSADPLVQDPQFTQSFNRYSYTFNNPLRYTDPSGFSAADDPPAPRPDPGYDPCAFCRVPPRVPRIGTPIVNVPLRDGAHVIPASGLECDQVECEGGGTQRRGEHSQPDRL